MAIHQGLSALLPKGLNTLQLWGLTTIADLNAVWICSSGEWQCGMKNSTCLSKLQLCTYPLSCLKGLTFASFNCFGGWDMLYNGIVLVAKSCHSGGFWPKHHMPANPTQQCLKSKEELHVSMMQCH